MVGSFLPFISLNDVLSPLNLSQSNFHKYLPHVLHLFCLDFSITDIFVQSLAK